MVSDILKQLSAERALLTIAFLILAVGAGYWDFKKKKIPDRLTAGILTVAVLGLFLLKEPDICARLSGFFAVSVPMLVISLVRPGAFGGGDIKFMAACGLFVGAGGIFRSFFYALVLAGVYGLYLILYKNKSMNQQFALGPFLTSGIFLHLIFLYNIG